MKSNFEGAVSGALASALHSFVREPKAKRTLLAWKPTASVSSGLETVASEGWQ